ncbi:cytochrome P450 4F6-like [Dysidea avara]|uniref:cytochrome P450 4F6-like n=1 Tax=Dysidea avara TaxID=196820 RepID=UPI00332AD8B1
MDILYSFAIGFVVLLLILLSRFTGVIASWITWYNGIRHLSRSLPSPPRRWLWGNSLEFDFSMKSLQYIQDYHVKYPKWCVYWIGPFIPMVFTADLETVGVLLQQSGEAPKPRGYDCMHKWTGLGLVTSCGERWRRHRKMLTPAFHFDILKQYIPVYNEVSHKLLEIWSGLADSGESVEITEYLNLYTLDVLLRCIYSINSNCLEEREVPYLVATKELSRLLLERVYNPLLAFDWIYFATAAGHKFLHNCNLVHKFSEEVILQRRDELLKTPLGSQPTRKYQDFLDILLSARDENGEGLTDTEIREEVDTFMFGGHDTTAVALGWILYCLAMYKEHQEECRKEIREVLAGRDSDDITWEDLTKLNYTTMCIKETLRLYPIVPITSKLSEGFVGNGQRIPKGTWINIGIYTVHHDPLVWDDPERFDPTRFSAENMKNMDPFAFLTFSAGPRNCIGQRFAMQELKVTVAHIVNRFLLEMDTTHTVEPHFHAMLKSTTGIKLKLL